jgi:NAD(P)-dependent dehydrogenase (short-subunit alcohol dehydrogenase family)
MTQTVLITGASSGIGHATAQLFAQQGWNVVATMRDPAHGAPLTKLDRVFVTRLDVQHRETILAAVEAGIQRFGKIDALVNNAGYGQYGLFESVSREKVQEQFDVNVFGVMDVTRAILPQFRRHKRGVVINVSSGAGLFTLPMISLYCASKFALEGFSEALSYELASQNINVKLVVPHGGVNSTQFNERSAQSRDSVASIADYDEFVKSTNEAFAGMSAARTISSEDVAKVIFDAATDGTDRLRYLVGNDTRGFIKARRELDDQEYVNFMRGHFRKK